MHGGSTQEITAEQIPAYHTGQIKAVAIMGLTIS
jgi:hypothetical protein